MINIGKHIEILLLSNDCVIVPDLGGFMAHHVDARYDTEEQIFLPPLRTLGFNPQLKINDSLLVQSYIEAYDISYVEALHRIEAEVSELKQHLETAGRYELNGIGTLQLNADGNLLFDPCEAGILTPQLYGLSTVEMPLLETAQDSATEETEEEEKTPAIRMAWVRTAVAAVAIITLLVLIGQPLSTGNQELQQSTILPIPATTVTKTKPAAQPAKVVVPAKVEEEPQPSFCLVMASHVSKRNSEDFISRLNKAGFSEARIYETEKMRRVVYGKYPTQQEALDALKKLKAQSQHFNEAWVLEVSE